MKKNLWRVVSIKKNHSITEKEDDKVECSVKAKQGPGPTGVVSLLIKKEILMEAIGAYRASCRHNGRTDDIRPDLGRTK